MAKNIVVTDEFGTASTAPELANLKVAQLRVLAQQLGIRGYLKLKKAELVQALEEHQRGGAVAAPAAPKAETPSEKTSEKSAEASAEAPAEGLRARPEDSPYPPYPRSEGRRGTGREGGEERVRGLREVGEVREAHPLFALRDPRPEARSRSPRRRGPGRPRGLRKGREGREVGEVREAHPP